MDMLDLIKREHAKTSSFFDRLADTSDGAVKTRERLVAQLKTGLEAHLSVVQDVIYPLLRKSEETRELVPDLKERNELRRQLVELERTPKDDQGFLAKVKELKKAVEQQLRAEEKQIVPALKKMLDKDEAVELAKRLAAETREEMQEAKELAEQGEEAGNEVVKFAGTLMDRNAEMARQSAERLSGSARQTLAETAETSRRVLGASAAGSRQLAENVAEQARRTGQSALEAAKIYSETGRRAADDLRALMRTPGEAAGAVREMQRVWVDLLGQATQRNTRTVQALLRCSTLQQVAEVQRDAMTENLQAWLEGGARVLRTVRETSDDLLRPIEERIDEGQREQRRRTNAARSGSAA